MYKKIGNDDGPGGRRIRVSFLEKKTFKNIIFLMKAEIKIGEQEGLLSFNSQTFLMENFKDTSVLPVGF